LPRIGHVATSRRQIVAPHEFRRIQPAARGKFPFGFGRQLLSGPFCIGRRILKRDVDHRVVWKLGDRARRPARMFPVGTAHVSPPNIGVAEAYGLLGFYEDGGRRREHLRFRPWIINGIGEALG